MELTEDDRVLIGGRTDNAQIHTDLYRVLHETFTQDRLRSLRRGDEPYAITLYGEGYGAGIQKGGGNYRPDKGFILFDVLVSDKWLDLDATLEIADKLEIDHVPTLGLTWSIEEITDFVRNGFESQAGVGYFGKGYHLAEGIVAKPISTLYDRKGDRVIFKLKHKDFTDGK